jgi:hypothetical protein
MHLRFIGWLIGNAFTVIGLSFFFARLADFAFNLTIIQGPGGPQVSPAHPWALVAEWLLAVLALAVLVGILIAPLMRSMGFFSPTADPRILAESPTLTHPKRGLPEQPDADFSTERK